MSEQKERPIGIHLENCENVTLTDNTGVGDMDFIVAKNSKNIKGSGNKHIIPNQESDLPNKQWFEKPHGIFLLGLAVTVCGGGILKYLGWI